VRVAVSRQLPARPQDWIELQNQGEFSSMTRNLLFICSQNRLRSPTAEQVFAGWQGIETASAGLNHGADNPVTPELLAWADLIFVMERAHRSKLSKKFKAHLGGKRVVCLDIPDDYDYMDPGLVRLLESKVPRHLPSR
jgi:predicted protein tyrosine phosphatase